MKDITKLIRSYADDAKLVSDFQTYVVIEEILKTAKLLQKWNLGEWKILDKLVLDEFKLDIQNNCLHAILWENWMRFIADIELIDIEVKWAYPFALWITPETIEHLESLVKNEVY